MWILITTILAITIFEVAALRWGVNSRESGPNPDWMRLERTGTPLTPVPVSIERDDSELTDVARNDSGHAPRSVRAGAGGAQGGEVDSRGVHTAA